MSDMPLTLALGDDYPEIREDVAKICTGFPGAPQLRHALMRAPTPAEALALLQRQL